MVRTAALCAAFLFAQFPAYAGSNDLDSGKVPANGPQDYTFPAVTLSTPPKIDGKVDSGEWPEGARREGFFDQGTGAGSDEKGEFWLASDAKYVYFAARVVTDPRKVVSDEYRQGVDLHGNDNMTLALDCYGTSTAVNTFGLNAAGATSIQLAGGRAAKTEWLGEFEGYGRKTETGWECEARIPWALMSLPGAGIRDMKFNVFWFRSNKSNTYEWKYAKQDFKNFPVWKGVLCPSIKQDHSLKVLPYGYLGLNEDGGLVANSGVDFKTTLPNQLQVVGTINPDFRNIENNILSLDFSYFERLAADARPFFQEGARFYQTGFDQRLFASQRIADFDAGVNVYGNLNAGKTRFGAMSITDFGNQQSTVVSVGQKVTPKYDLNFAYVGNLKNGENNDGFELDNSYQVKDAQFYLNSQFTSDQEHDRGHRMVTGYFYSANGWNYGVEWAQISKNFFPRLGFSPEQDLKGVNFNLFKEVQPKHGPFSAIQIESFGVQYDHFDGGFYRKEIAASVNFAMRNALSVGVGADFSNFEGSPDHHFDVGLEYPYTNPYRNLGLQFTDGEFDGDHYRSWALSFQYRPINRMQVSVGTQFVDYRGFQRQVIGSVRFDIGKNEAIGGRFVNSGDQLNWYGFYRFSGRKGNEYFLILGDPNSPTFTRQVILKVTVPFSIRF